MSIIFFNDTATTEIYTLSLHDALPICQQRRRRHDPADDLEQPGQRVGRAQFLGLGARRNGRGGGGGAVAVRPRDRKSTRLNSSHANISYAVFFLKKKKIVLRLPLFNTT